VYEIRKKKKKTHYNERVKVVTPKMMDQFVKKKNDGPSSLLVCLYGCCW